MSGSERGARSDPIRLAVLGSGPVGLEAALAGLERGYDVRVYEAAASPAGNVRDWGHVRLFSPWDMNVSERMRDRLREAGAPLETEGDRRPTGHELADRVLDPLWARAPLASRLRLGSRVVALGREGLLKHEEIGSRRRRERPFRLLIADPSGREWVERAHVVLDCTGKYGSPNPLGDGGIPAPGERTLGGRIHRGIPDLQASGPTWRNRTVLLAGSGHSAQTAARDLARLAEGGSGLRVLWALRRAAPDWGAVQDDPLPARRALTDEAERLFRGASPAVEPLPGVVVEGLEAQNGRSRVRLRDGAGGTQEVVVDRILALTGGVGDHALYRQLQVHECYATSGPMKLAAALLGSRGGDCLAQESHGADTLLNPEPDFFILGDKSYGRNNTFLMRVGWQQVEEVFGALEAAR